MANNQGSEGTPATGTSKVNRLRMVKSLREGKKMHMKEKNTIGFRKCKIQLRMVVSYFFAWLPDIFMFLKAMGKRKIKTRGVIQTCSM